MINALADQYIYNIQSFLPNEVDLTLFDPANGLPQLDDADALLIRTVNPITRESLPQLPPRLSFVGTASAGSDHVDTNYLKANEITFSDAAGCNARSVAEYVATALILWSEHHQKNIQQLTVGIVGVGNVGTQVQNLLHNLKIQTVCYDPPRAKREQDFTSATLEEVLDCNILTFHTPLTRKTEYPTFHWLDEEKLSNYHFQLILNTARGGVVDEKTLRQAMAEEMVQDITIDTWENEPEFNLRTADKAFFKTPHIAGYSIQAKENASRLVADALIEHFDLSGPEEKKRQSHRILEKDISYFDSLSALLRELHPIKEYESELQKIIDKHPKKRATLFNRLRAQYPLRQEFAQTYLPASYFERFPVLKALRFTEIESESL